MHIELDPSLVLNFLSFIAVLKTKCISRSLTEMVSVWQLPLKCKSWISKPDAKVLQATLSLFKRLKIFGLSSKAKCFLLRPQLPYAISRNNFFCVSLKKRNKPFL